MRTEFRRTKGKKRERGRERERDVKKEKEMSDIEQRAKEKRNKSEYGGGGET